MFTVIKRSLSLNSSIIFFVAFVFSILIPVAVSADDIDGKSIIADIEKRLWGKTSQGTYKMTISTAYWKRTLSLSVFMQRPDKSFIRILSPAKEAGVGSLRIKNEMWNYLPKIERVVKVPPSMMLQSWMGSDFTNDDLVKESSMINDYTHEITSTPVDDNIALGNEPAYQIISIPKPNAPVVWGKLVYVVRKSDLMPLSFNYFDERGRLIKSLTFSNVREIEGRQIPTRWEMRSTDKPKNATVFELVDITFDKPIPKRVFTLRNLRGR